MDIAVIGASGTIGRQIAISLVQEHVISSNARLQLVGRLGGFSEQILPALASDLADAYAEIIPNIEVIFEPTKIKADIIIVAAGQTLSATPAHLLDHLPDRLELAKVNFPILKTYAQAIESQSHGEELILIVTNPVELGVHIFSQHHSRFRVIGIGAFLDTLRFRREIASELGIRRQNVQGLVLGEHGMLMVPCWSTVSAYGFNSLEGKAQLSSLQNSDEPELKAALTKVIELLATEGAEAAYNYVVNFSAALRTILKPFITHCSGAKTPVGVAEIITRLVEILVSGNQMLAAAQVALKGEFLNITGVTGVPVVLSHSGVRIESINLSSEEELKVLAAAEKFNNYLTELLI
jgi:malate dehydrogenase